MVYEKTIDSKQIFSGKILNLRVDQVALPDNLVSYREIVEHKKAIGVLPIVDGSMIFVRQFRKAIESWVTEIPAGLIESDEKPDEAAEREMREEIGLRPLDLRYLGKIWSSPGFTNEMIYLYTASIFEENALEPDADENIEVLRIPVRTVYALYQKGYFTDAKTVSALGYYFSQGF